ncbi:GGDEF domain-containing protein [Sterolibacterium denitrificans]|uniref:GGDEF domain-containing protein n=1 Tax=Sterolibacterium denitrificans TaxID=157592 RepID=UPI00128F913A|nr:GGDEF domain-containing protein [Sterolibacterium denitrificans]
MRRSPLSLVVDYFIHPSYRLDSDTFFRGRILIAAMLVFVIVSASAYLAVLATPFLSTSVFWASLILPPATLSFVTLLVLIRRRGGYMFCSIASVLVIYLIIVIGICVSGGPAVSPVVQLLVVPPLVAYFFGGLRWGGRAVAITFPTLIILIVLHLLGVPFLQTVTTEAQMDLARGIITFLNLAVISGMAFIYEFTAAALKRERDLEHEKYIQLAKTDPLTGLANRRNFDDMLKERAELYGAQIPPRRFALGYLDLDGFKPINDQYGHAVGDEVLRVISERLRAALRGSDFVGRHGGDEFMLLLDTVGSQEALEAMADRMLSSIAQPIKTSAGIVGVTGSLGFAMFPLDAVEIKDLMKAADDAMYTAKQKRGSWHFYRKHHTQAAP